MLEWSRRWLQIRASAWSWRRVSENAMVHSSLAAKMLPAPQTVRLCSVTSPPLKTERPVADAFKGPPL